MRPRSGLRNRVEAGLARALVSALEVTPRPVADALGLGCARLLDVVAPRLRQTAYTNLAFAYPERDGAWRRGIVDGVYESIGRLLVAFARISAN